MIKKSLVNNTIKKPVALADESYAKTADKLMVDKEGDHY